ncbi:hypothetical protein PLESTB_000699400 [Pleodorina starrii]|uniref:Uncharacterized protein n=1 Tax=Pleodorina starrii TaxID=330485 RepID=A0A9W6BJQ9_9CHLO|nr:hypothetical protein PLESTM_001217400 [Pleodorina starrii]GLC53020.1 hypothetical protein PLESTB_000699400 [Pleodorina starrii]GLC75033.1 hypothetical protein PLESTF_001585700 [Pleodorina starrii]
MQALRVRVATPAGITRTVPLCPALLRQRGRVGAVLVRASNDSKDSLVSDAIKAASGLVDKATELVPESVPRPAAKTGVTIAGIMFIFWLLQKVISGVVTLALFAGVGYYFLTQQGAGADKDGDAIDVTSSSSSSSSKKKGGRSGDDLDDPLAEARRIMDKYK